MTIAAATTNLIAEFSAAVASLASVSKDVAEYRALDDETLIELSKLSSTQRQLADTHLALVAGEIAHRSSRELGSRGLAQRTGYRTTEEFVRVATRSTARDASTAVRVGRLVRNAAAADQANLLTGEFQAVERPWLSSIAAAVTAGGLPIAAAESISNGLGEPTDSITSTMLAGAVTMLLGEATVLDADRLYSRARQLRDELDESEIADHERARREQRSIRFATLADGMSRLVWMLDPESATLVRELYDRATSPKRGGPRFVGPEHAHRAEQIGGDSRTIEQLASDVFVELLQHGANVDSSQILGIGPASVRVLVTRESISSRRGFGRIEGVVDPISIETVERIACSDGIVEVVFDDSGEILNLGREQRLFSRKQRVALATRDGGCRWPLCERPPSWTEAHHIEHWKRDSGRTDVALGILLCKHHHLLVHNNRWEIRRDRGDFWLIPPADIDPEHKELAMPSKSALIRNLRRGVPSAAAG